LHFGYFHVGRSRRRHTFISDASAGGGTLAEVRNAAGHANVSITSGYLHVAVEDEATVGELFRLA
jgi:site-specific recombinase XerD